MTKIWSNYFFRESKSVHDIETKQHQLKAIKLTWWKNQQSILMKQKTWMINFSFSWFRLKFKRFVEYPMNNLKFMSIYSIDWYRLYLMITLDLLWNFFFAFTFGSPFIFQLYHDYRHFWFPWIYVFIQPFPSFFCIWHQGSIHNKAGKKRGKFYQIFKVKSVFFAQSFFISSFISFLLHDPEKPKGNQK